MLVLYGFTQNFTRLMKYGVLQHCAQTLLEFNGGASCVQVYVNQHDFFINSGQKAKPPQDDVL